MLSYSIITDSTGDCLPISCLILLFLTYFFSLLSVQTSSLLNHPLSHPTVVSTFSHPYFPAFRHPTASRTNIGVMVEQAIIKLDI